MTRRKAGAALMATAGGAGVGVAKGEVSGAEEYRKQLMFAPARQAMRTTALEPRVETMTRSFHISGIPATARCEYLALCGHIGAYGSEDDGVNKLSRCA